ncbi:ABC transporter permease [Dethiobacter alkaliphilus]|nr:ABC transporter permease [Dethiobacter alkaliphilus]
MYATFMISEWKKWQRDPMMGILIFYPLFLALIGRYLLPYIADTSGFPLEMYADIILASLSLMTPLIFGALIGFSVLDDRDDQILTSIQVTPLSLYQFLSFRMLMITFISFIAVMFVLWFSDIYQLSLAVLLSISFLAALGAPVTGFIINALSKNKIEGFAVMKGAGTVLIVPVLSLLFTDAREFFFAVVPGFWPAKALSVAIHGESVLLLTYYQYYFAGLVYVVLLNILAYRWFLGKVKV